MYNLSIIYFKSVQKNFVTKENQFNDFQLLKGCKWLREVKPSSARNVPGASGRDLLIFINYTVFENLFYIITRCSRQNLNTKGVTGRWEKPPSLCPKGSVVLFQKKIARMLSFCFLQGGRMASSFLEVLYYVQYNPVITISQGWNK